MKVFVDTSAWLALNDRNDQYYRKAVERLSIIKKQKIELVTSEYIVDEAITIIRYRVSHKTAVVLGDSILNSSIVKIIDITDEDRLKAWDLFVRYEDKEFSFTDCASFIIMKRFKIQKAFTFDEHFAQMGFEIF